MNRIARVVQTVKYLKPVQIVYQIKRYLPKPTPKIPEYKGTRKCKGLMIPELDLSKGFSDRFKVDGLLENKLFLLNEEHELPLQKWNIADASHLWNFNLHYLEYCVALAAEYHKTGDERCYNKVIEIIRFWIQNNTYSHGDGWHPYTISMRFANVMITLELLGEKVKSDGDVLKYILSSLYRQYRFLICRLELQQLGNHYLENLKSIIIGSIIFNENDIYAKFIKKLKAEVSEEILSDGMHFELSPMYQKIVLEDLLRLYKILDGEDREFIKPYISKMASATEFLEEGLDRTPLFNDSGDNVAKKVTDLLKACKCNDIMWQRADSLPAAGYFKLKEGQITVLIDAGKIGPDYMPGHGHCDCLSFELAAENEPVFVNSGTLQYQGSMRSYFRATRAHNTVSIDGEEQSDCWGEHRVGKRISRIETAADISTFNGKYTNFCGDVHEREIKLSDKRLTVIDTVPEGKKASSYLHLGIGFEVKKISEKYLIFKGEKEVCSIMAINSTVTVFSEGELTNYAPEFGLLHNTRCFEFTWTSDERKHGYEIHFSK